MIIRSLLESTLSQLGIAGVSVTVVAGLLLIATWAHKAAAAGGLVVAAGSTAQHDIKIAALLLAVMAVLGIVSVNVDRSMTIAQLLWEQVQNIGGLGL